MKYIISVGNPVLLKGNFGQLAAKLSSLLLLLLFQACGITTTDLLSSNHTIDNLHVSHNASGMGANIRELVT